MDRTNLFVKWAEDDESEVGYDASYEMPPQVDRWGDEIVAQLLTKSPFLADTIAAPTFEMLDENTRLAVGHIIARGGNAVIQVPFVVQDGKLSPMDIFISEGKPYPLTEGRIKEVFFNPQLGDSLVHDPWSSIARYNAYGLDGVTGYRNYYDSYKGASLIDLVSRMPRESKEKLAQQIASDPLSLERLEKGCGPVVLERFLGNAEPVVDPVPSKLAAVQVERVGPGKYRIAEWNFNQPPKEAVFAGKAASEKLAAMGLEVALLDAADGKGLVTERGSVGIATDDLHTNSPVPLYGDVVDEGKEFLRRVDKSGAYTVYTPTLEAKSAYIFPDVRTLEGEKSPYSLILPVDNDSHGYQTEIVGIPDEDEYGTFRAVTSTNWEKMYEAWGRPDEHWLGSEIRKTTAVGRMITLVYEDPEYRRARLKPRSYNDPPLGPPVRVAIEPIRVSSAFMIRGENGVSAIRGTTLMGKPVTLVFSKNLKRAVKVDRDSAPVEVRMSGAPGVDIWAVPTDWTVIPINSERLTFVDDPAQLRAFAKQAAMDQLGATDIFYSNGRYEFRGSWAEKMASLVDPTWTSSPHGEAQFLLCAGGCDEEMAGKALKTAKEKGSITVCGLWDHEKIAASLPGLRPRLPGIGNPGSIIKKTAPKLETIAAMKSLVDKVASKDTLRIKAAAAIPGMMDAISPDSSNFESPVAPVGGPALLSEGADAEAMEGILGLGFLNRDNIEFFIAQVPQLDKAIMLLSQMLLAIRLRPNQHFLEESLVREALNHLEDVVENLKGFAD